MGPLRVFYDGKCIICYREIQHYLKLDKSKSIIAIDIAGPSFNADKYGLNETEINIHIHSMDDSGQVFTGVDTFFEIWKRVPPYSRTAFLLKSKKVRPLLDVGYKVFAHHIRPRLPKRKCEDDYCSYKSMV